MEDLLDLIEGLIDAVMSAFDYLWSIITDTLYVVELLGKFVAEIPSYFAWMPEELLVIVIAVFPTLITLRIVGWI